MMGDIKECLKFRTNTNEVCIIKDDIEITEFFHSDQIQEYFEKFKLEAQKKNKKLDDYLSDLAFNKIRERLKIDIEDFIKLRSNLLQKTADQILFLYKKRIEFHHIDVVPFYKDIISKYSKLRGELVFDNGIQKFSQKNFATFKTKILESSKEVDTINELVHSSNIELYENFINSYKNSDELVKVFKNGVKDYNGRPRTFDSEVKYIFNFLMKHLHRGDEFIIETKNIYYACPSCQREFIMFEEFLKSRGKKVKFIINSDEKILGGDALYDLIKNK